MTALMHNFAKLIHSYEVKNFEAKFWQQTCSQYCSFYGICPAAQDNTWL